MKLNHFWNTFAIIFNTGLLSAFYFVSSLVRLINQPWQPLAVHHESLLCEPELDWQPLLAPLQISWKIPEVVFQSPLEIAALSEIISDTPLEVIISFFRTCSCQTTITTFHLIRILSLSGLTPPLKVLKISFLTQTLHKQFLKKWILTKR